MKSDRFEQMIKAEKRDGWHVKEDGDEQVVLVKRGYGTVGEHAVVALLTIWYTFGLGNVIYIIYKYSAGADEKTICDPQLENSTGTA